MLHQPASTFEPSLPIPSDVQSFDAKRYLYRARALGIMVFPVIMPSGGPTFGLCAYPGYSWSVGNERLAGEFGAELRASSDGTDAVFEELCADFGLDPADAGFNDKVAEVCRARSEASTDGDKRLIELCKRARIALERDVAATNRHCDLTEEFEKIELARPTYSSPLGGEVKEYRDSREMKQILADGIPEWSRTAVKNYRARIAKVVAYEKERDHVKREIGLTKAEAAENAASRRAKALVADVAELPAMTLLGLAHKAALMPVWDKAGYGLDDEGERLAFSIADDARMLGTGGQIMRVSGRRRPSQQVNH